MDNRHKVPKVKSLKIEARYLLTYVEAMTRLFACYKAGGAVQESEAYIDGKPACAGMSFLRTTAAKDTVLTTRNSLMQCHLSHQRSVSTAAVMFRLIASIPESLEAD